MDVSKKIDINGDKAWMRKLVGWASDTREWQESWVSGNAYNLTVNRIDRQSFWVVNKDFQEKVFSNLSVRSGNEVALVWVGHEGYNGNLALALNKTTGEYVWHLSPKRMVKNHLPAIIFFSLSSVMSVLGVFNAKSTEQPFVFLVVGAILIALTVHLINRRMKDYNFWDQLTDQALIFARD